MAEKKEPRAVMRERSERLLEYCAHLYALGFKPPQIAEKAMEVTDPAPLFADRSNRESNRRIVRTVIAKVEAQWSEKQAKMHPHAVGSFLAKKEKLESSLWPLATARTRITVREYIAVDPLTNKPRRVKETVTEGPHPIVQAAAIRELGKTIDDIHIVLGVDVKGRQPAIDPLDDLFRQTTDELLNAHEERKRQQLQDGSIPVTASHPEDGDDGGPRSGGGPPTSVM